MPRVALTDRFVASVRTTSRENYFDTKTRGLVLRVTPSTRTWAFVYRMAGKPSQWLVLGAYDPNGLTLAKARALAGTHRHAVDVEQRDPAAEKRAEKAKAAEPPTPPPAPPKVFTFADMAALYEKTAAAKKRTAHEDMQKIRRHLLPAWGDRPLADITRKDVHALLDSLVGAGLTIGVNRVQAVISRLFTIALDRGLVDAHPAARMEKRFAEQPADRVLTDDELRALWAGLDAQPGPAADAIRLRALTGQRGGEVAGLQWAEVDLDARLWTLPGARTKNKRPHAVPLSASVVAILERRRGDVAEDEPRVFPGLTLHADAHRALAAIHGGAYEWKDLRRTVATRLAGLGFDETTIGRVLNHAAVSVTAKHYNRHAYQIEKAAALDAWDAELQRIIAGKPKPSKVLAHRPRGRR
ncbi:MAG: tyrosine-type recombinase/integrase [Vicinamibacterales bacterium]